MDKRNPPEKKFWGALLRVGYLFLWKVFIKVAENVHRKFVEGCRRSEKVGRSLPNRGLRGGGLDVVELLLGRGLVGLEVAAQS